MDCLPEDLLMQILVKIPCNKSILRCTSVSKSWYSCIKSPAFITLHLRRKNNDQYLLCDFKLPSGRDRYVSINNDTESLAERNRLLFPGEWSDGMVVLGSCNGLVCYTKTYNGPICLWNPAIRRVKELPRYRDHGRSCFGLWFDRKVNDHMVAKISTGQGLSVDVYSLRTNSWKTITESVPARSVSADRDLAYVDGKLHWPVGRKGSSGGWKICCLDLETGILRETLISWNKKLSDLYLMPLGEHSLAVFGSTDASDSEGWAARRCCMAQAYDQNMNKLYTIDLERATSYNLHRVVGLRNNGEALFLELDSDDSGLVCCNTTTKVSKRFVSRLQYYKLQRVRPFIETLVLLDDEDAEESVTPNLSRLWLCLLPYILFCSAPVFFVLSVVFSFY
ncbi:hypothetical protein ACET3Z_008534 [Daucus carota]